MRLLGGVAVGSAVAVAEAVAVGEALKSGSRPFASSTPAPPMRSNKTISARMAMRPDGVRPRVEAAGVSGAALVPAAGASKGSAG